MFRGFVYNVLLSPLTRLEIQTHQTRINIRLILAYPVRFWAQSYGQYMSFRDNVKLQKAWDLMPSFVR